MKSTNKIIIFNVLIILGLIITSCNREISESISTAFQEPHRPQFHFSPPEKWMNDPNGMVYYEGEYHLFYQHYPDSNVWGPMHWGHAVSKDLVHWEHLPIAIYPDSLGYIFSGSAVIDLNNTSGLGSPGNPPMVAIFTYHNPEGERSGRQDFQYQGIAYSLDKGRTWTKYAGNPVVPNTESIRDFRDPKVIWHELTQQWIMVFAAYDHVKLWASPDLIHWKLLSNFGKNAGSHSGVWECPDMFPMQVEGSTDTKWVILSSINPGGPSGGSATQYFVGDFDGKKFELDPEFAKEVTKGKGVWLDGGRDNYAGVTWSDIPASDGRRLFMGWMSNWDYAQVVPTTVWRSAMTLPRELTLHQTPGGYRIFSCPVKQLQSLRGTRAAIPGTAIEGILDLSTPLKGISPAAMELKLDFIYSGTEADFGVELSNEKGDIYRIGFDAARKVWYSDRSRSGKNNFSESFAGPRPAEAPRVSGNKTVRFHLFFDSASAELFADDGANVLTEIFFPQEPFSKVKVYAGKGKVKLIGGEGFALRGIW